MSETDDSLFPTLVWEIGLDEKTIREVKENFAVGVFSVPLNADKVLELNLPQPEVILVGDRVASEERLELVQIAGLKYNKVPIYQVVRDIRKFDRNEAIKIGMQEAFLLPFERVLFEETVIQHIAQGDAKVKQIYEMVRLVDIDPNKKLTFDLNVYLRANRKFICLVKKGSSLGEAKKSKLQNKMKTAYVNVDEMQEFFKLVNEDLHKRSPRQEAGATEIKLKLYKSVKNLVREFLNPSKTTPADTMKALLKDFKLQIRNLLAQTTFDNWQGRFNEIYGDRLDSAYTHACNVALYACFLSMGANIGNPEDLALAGVLHDIGLAHIDEEALQKDYEELNDEQKSIYRTHVQKTVNALSSRPIELPSVVLKAVSQHHEYISGAGFPVGLKDDKIIPEAQILMLADHFDELASYTDVREAMTPQQAITKIIAEEDKKMLTVKRYDPKILATIDDLFEKTAKPRRAS